MFKDEIKQKMNIKDGLVGFCMTMPSRDKLIVSGAKGVLTSAETLIRLRLYSGIFCVQGENLQIVEIGGGDVYCKGKISQIAFE